MPGIGEGRKFSSFEPAGSRFSKAARGSADWSAGTAWAGLAAAARTGVGVASAAAACVGSASAARIPSPVVQTTKAMAARILNISDSDEFDRFDPAASERFMQSYHSAK